MPQCGTVERAVVRRIPVHGRTLSEQAVDVGDVASPGCLDQRTMEAETGRIIIGNAANPDRKSFRIMPGADLPRAGPMPRKS